MKIRKQDALQELDRGVHITGFTSDCEDPNLGSASKYSEDNDSPDLGASAARWRGRTVKEDTPDGG